MEQIKGDYVKALDELTDASKVPKKTKQNKKTIKWRWCDEWWYCRWQLFSFPNLPIHSLARLCLHVQPVLNYLSMLAEDYKEHASVVTDVITERIRV